MDLLINNCFKFNGVCLFDEFGQSITFSNNNEDILWSIELVTKNVKKKIEKQGMCILSFKVKSYVNYNILNIVNSFFKYFHLSPVWTHDFTTVECVLSSMSSTMVKNDTVKCEICFKTFKKELTLQTHMRKFHSVGL
jgi:F0F1-type ATP synthase gamma subunit